MDSEREGLKMVSKKFALLLAVVFVLASIPALASATISRQPVYNQVTPASTTVTGRSDGAVTLTLTFPNGSSVTTSAHGSGVNWTWSAPVSGTLRANVDRIKVDYTDGRSTGQFYIPVDPAGVGLDGTPGPGSGTGSGTTDTGTGTTDGASTNNGAAVTSSTDATVAADAATPQTGDVNARPILYTAAGLFIFGLALALTIRAWWRRQQA